MISKIVIKCCESKKYLSEDFLGKFMRNDSWDYLFGIFSGIEELLEDLYILVKDVNFDYKGTLGINLIRRNPSFWNRFTLKLNNDYSRVWFPHNMFECIWGMENYRELIEIAFNNILENSSITHNKISMIFSNGEETSAVIKKRKEQWIEAYIQNNFENMESMCIIFNVIATLFPLQRIKFLLMLTQYTKNIELLKNIPLFAYPEMVVGRKVLPIDRKIEFLKDLIASLNGIDFIEYRYWLEKKKNALEEQREKLLLQEYLENNDIA